MFLSPHFPSHHFWPLVLVIFLNLDSRPLALVSFVPSIVLLCSKTVLIFHSYYLVLNFFSLRSASSICIVLSYSLYLITFSLISLQVGSSLSLPFFVPWSQRIKISYIVLSWDIRFPLYHLSNLLWKRAEHRASKLRILVFPWFPRYACWVIPVQQGAHLDFDCQPASRWTRRSVEKPLANLWLERVLFHGSVHLFSQEIQNQVSTIEGQV